MAFVRCDSPEDIAELERATLPGIGYVEDWTGSIAHYCLRCSYGAPHRHGEGVGRTQEGGQEWEAERNLGIGSQSKAAVTRLLEEWASRGPGRHVEGIETRDCVPPEPEQGYAWWREPDEEEEA